MRQQDKYVVQLVLTLAQDQFPFLKWFVNNWPLYDILSRFLQNHSRYLQTKLSGLDVTRGGLLEDDESNASDVSGDPQDEEDDYVDASDGDHDPQTDENAISRQVVPSTRPAARQSKAPSKQGARMDSQGMAGPSQPRLTHQQPPANTHEKRAPKQGACTDLQAMAGPSRSRSTHPPPTSHHGPSKAACKSSRKCVLSSNATGTKDMQLHDLDT
ncbi:hypothetical protein HD554DRAFT_10549 [Boletus coccyginus]|nr:hypothetical protein HD554DRAFT_10549 [Boletus coccyginus]